MPKVRPCRLCPSKRFGSSRLCYAHWREKERTKREENRKKKLDRKLKSKKYQDGLRKSLIKKCDAVFSKLIRSADRCLYCGKTSAQAQLHCSHVYSRKNLSVRWDEMNAKCLCSYHHRRFWHEQPKEALEWLTGLWGDEHMEELKRKANTVRQWTVIELTQLLADLQQKLSNLK